MGDQKKENEPDQQENEPPEELPHYSDKGGHRERGSFWRRRRERDKKEDFRSRRG